MEILLFTRFYLECDESIANRQQKGLLILSRVVDMLHREQLSNYIIPYFAIVCQ